MDNYNELVAKKAEEIFNLHKELITSFGHQLGHEYEIYKDAKLHAILTVNIIINNTDMYTGNLNPKFKFWQDVKKELEKYGK